MDVDNEIDQTLLQQFSCMGTTDKDDLIKHMQAIVGHQITSHAAAFFLEMNNWNLQAAVGSFFDINSSHKLPSMLLTKDVAVTKGDGIAPNTKFIKSWHIQNNGSELWPSGCYLQFTGGVCMSHQEKIPVVPIAPGCCTCLSIEMTSPSEPGIYQSKWRMCTSSGSYFGDVIWVILTVVDNNELEGLTQQLSHLSDLGSPPRTHGSQVNPFNSFETFLQDFLYLMDYPPFYDHRQTQEGEICKIVDTVNWLNLNESHLNQLTVYDGYMRHGRMAGLCF